MTSIKTYILCFLVSMTFISQSFAQCTNAPFGQWPTVTFTPICNGSQQLIVNNAFTGEYSVIAVTAGIQYIFSSSVATDYITITNSSGVVLNTAVGSITGTPNFTGTLRFYRHNSSACGASQQNRSIFVTCGQNNPAGDVTFYFGETLEREDLTLGNAQVEVPVRTLGFSNMGGFQFTIRIEDNCGPITLDEPILTSRSSTSRLLGIQNIHPGLQSGLTVFVDPANRFITLNWATSTSLSLTNATKLFDVIVGGPPSPIGPDGCCDFLFFDNSPTPIFANNSVFEELNVITEDTHGICPVLPKICGCIYREDLVPIPNVEVNIFRNGQIVHVALTGGDGCYEYEVPNLVNSDVFQIVPQKLTNPVTNGINSLDVNILASYISNPNANNGINSPYKLISANVNTDGNINTIDRGNLSRALTGSIQQWPNNTPSWRFVPVGYNFGVLDSPPTVFNIPRNYPESKTIQGSSIQNNNCHDFIGTKIGDLNLSNNPSNLQDDDSGLSQRRNSNTLLYFGGINPSVLDTVIVLQDNEMLLDSVVKLHLYTKDFMNIKAFETALKWDTDEMSFYKLSTKDEFGNLVSDIGMTDESFRYDTTNQRIIFFWDDRTFNPEGRTFNDGTLVLVLEFKVKAKAIQNRRISPIENDNEIRQSLYFNKDNRGFEFNIESREVVLDFTNSTQNSLQDAIKIYPSITSGDLFLKNVKERTQIIIYDNYGKMVLNTLIHSEANINISNLPSGMYYIRALNSSSNGQFTHKIIKN
jgi:hypothetical protein